MGLKVRSSRIGKVRASRRLLVEVSLNEAAKVALTAVARVGGRKVKIASGAVELTGAGTRREELRVTRAGKRALARRSRVGVTVSARAVDTAGNAASAKTARTLRK